MTSISVKGDKALFATLIHASRDFKIGLVESATTERPFFRFSNAIAKAIF